MTIYTSFTHAGQEYKTVDLAKSLPAGVDVASLPFSLRVLLENILRTTESGAEQDGMVAALLARGAKGESADGAELRFYPSRVLMHDFTIPALMDLAAMREAVSALGGDASRINPLVPVAVTIDHSAQVDCFGAASCMEENIKEEYRLNSERFALLKWANKAMDNVTVVPPAKGICHQLQLELFSQVSMKKEENGAQLAYPDSMVGADSHTGTLGGIGVVAYGIGGIEIETVMLGEPSVMPVPQVVGVRLTGKLGAHVTATDLALTVTNLLRKEGVVECFVEYFGPGVDSLSIPARCTVANMAPEYGATLGFFAVDAKVVEYLRITGREEQAGYVEAAAKAGLLYSTGVEPNFARVLELDLSSIKPCISGPARPNQYIALDASAAHVADLLKDEKPLGESGEVAVTMENGAQVSLKHGHIALASLTSCTNTINPELMLAAGLLARNAVAKGLKVPAYIKTVLAPGSTTVTRYLKDADLLAPLEELGFYTVGYSCLTCIGNSGPLPAPVASSIKENNLNMCAVLSANRNFSGRVHGQIKSNFLASPMLVLAFALSGSMLTDMEKDALGVDSEGNAVYLKDIIPSDAEIAEVYAKVIKPEVFRDEYASLHNGGAHWDSISTPQSPTYQWDEKSTYIKRPPYFDGLGLEVAPLEDIVDARALAKFGDSVTTDHISPGGSIAAEYPAAKYLEAHGLSPKDFNTYGNRRGNHEVMMRGTFGNIRLQNHLASKDGSYTVKFPEKEEMFIFDAAQAYAKEKTPLVILAGKEYGTGSSRDWAAKGSYFLGVKIVVAQSFERIHRANLVGMGILPLQFLEGQDAQSLGLQGDEVFTVRNVQNIGMGAQVQVQVRSADGSEKAFTALARLDTQSELTCFKHGGILPFIMRKLLTT